MQAENNKVVSFNYILREAGGEELENNRESIPIAYLHGHNNILSGLEEALTGLKAGDTTQVTLPPERAYGPYNEIGRKQVPIKTLEKKYKRLLPGMFVRVVGQKGPVNATVIKPGKFMVEVDFNHPFAGKTLEFDIEVTNVRDATPEEIAHRHAHGDGGHHH